MRRKIAVIILALAITVPAFAQTMFQGRISGRELVLTLVLFTTFNAATVLGRQYDVTATGTTGYDQPLEIMNPRLLRFGVRFQF